MPENNPERAQPPIAAPGSDLALLIEAARAAAEVAVPLQSGDLQTRYKAGDQSPVTRADYAANGAIEQILRAARPGYGWLSEESPDNGARLSAERVFIVDPIDGTRAYVEGSDTWAHALAVVDRGAVIAGVVYLPRKGRLFAAARGMGAWLGAHRLAASDRTDPEGATALMTKPTMDPKHWPGGVPGVRRSYRPSLAYRLCLVAQGRYDAMATFRAAHEWDIAAGALLVTEAKGRATDAHGRALRFNAPRPQAEGCIVAGQALHEKLMLHAGIQP